MKRVDVRTQAELDAVVAAGDIAVVRGDAHVEARGSSHVEAWESSHVEARGSSHVVAWESSHVVAWESSHVVAWGSSHVVAWGSSHVVARGSSHVVARDSSHVVAGGSSNVEAGGSSHVVARDSSHVEAGGSSHVVARDSSHVVAGSHAAVHIQSPSAVVEGGVQIRRPEFTPLIWLDYCRVKHDGATAVLYKAVTDAFRSPRGGVYTPGTIPVADDWDGGKAECGGGLHFSPTPLAARDFFAEATRFVACPVAIADMFIPTDPEYPHKIKARGCCAPVWEVDRRGNPIGAKESKS